MEFDLCPSYKVLQKLAEKPFDLSDANNLTKQRLEKFQTTSGPFTLFYGTERLDEQVIENLMLLAKETKAIGKMKSMQEGKIVNSIEGVASENRPALHTAMRDFFEDPMQGEEAEKASSLAYLEIQKLDELIEELHRNRRFDTLVHIGIGGSDLGPRALYHALKPYAESDRKVYFVSNVDPDDMAATLKEVTLAKTLFVIVSKSGTTLETLANEKLAREALEKAGLDPKDQMIAITGQGSPMDDPSKYYRSFYIWDYVGGRYSSTSMVGAVTLSFGIGSYYFKELLRGASMMDKMALETDVSKNLPLLSALIGIWNRNFLNLPTLAIIPYSQGLIRFPAHLQQLDMESNGKSINRKGQFIDYPTGPIIFGEIGTNSQHSFYQLLHQSKEIIPIEFIGFKDSEYEIDSKVCNTTSQEKLLANLFAQSIAFASGKRSDNPNQYFSGNRPSSILMAKKLTPYTLGALLAYYEHKVAFQGFIWGINSFDQEGVQLGKKLAGQILDIFAGKKVNDPLGEFFTDSLKRFD